LIVYARSQKPRYALLMTRQIWQWAIMLFVLGFLMQGVNNWAHFGGFVGGWIASRLLVSNTRWHEGRVTVVVALLLLLITGAGFVLSIFDAIWGL
ncbi:MAG: rhomboid family intramembrane serine protease, partial [Candidatus Latescibacteria bacterium]|nr:rhomboid family intramembrane serine protease [Candidatus Latescibacterota bacterium]